jgi:hypothetical protein
MNASKVAVIFSSFAIFLSLLVGVAHAGTATSAEVFTATNSTPPFKTSLTSLMWAKQHVLIGHHLAQ